MSNAMIIPIDPCTIDGPWPFDRVTFTRIRHPNREPTPWVELVGERDGEARSVRVLYESLWEHMEVHMRSRHGTSLEEPHSYEDLRHAAMRAAVAFLMD